MSIPEQLRARRIELGLTQAQAAAMVSPPIAQSAWSLYERGSKAMTVETAERLAAALKMELALIQ